MRRLSLLLASAELELRALFRCNRKLELGQREGRDQLASPTRDGPQVSMVPDRVREYMVANLHHSRPGWAAVCILVAIWNGDR